MLKKARFHAASLAGATARTGWPMALGPVDLAVGDRLTSFLSLSGVGCFVPVHPNALG
jgi:hypothetical protein